MGGVEEGGDDFTAPGQRVLEVVRQCRVRAKPPAMLASASRLAVVKTALRHSGARQEPGSGPALHSALAWL
jgi:hypothetical protein